jgi:hypothetical protein
MSLTEEVCIVNAGMDSAIGMHRPESLHTSHGTEMISAIAVAGRRWASKGWARSIGQLVRGIRDGTGRTVGGCR